MDALQGSPRMDIMLAVDGSQHALAAAHLLSDLPLPAGSLVKVLAVLGPRLDTRRQFQPPSISRAGRFRGRMVLRSEHVTGYIRVDWFTPDGLPTWGDGRLFLLGTEGYIELRKYVDLAGRPGGDHFFLVNQEGMQYIDCSQVDLPYGPEFVQDVMHRTETAMSQAHCFMVSEISLRAQASARRIAG